MATCRKATLNDIPEIVRFQIAMAKETEAIELNLDVCAAGVRAVFERPESGQYFVSEIDGTVVASLLITHK